MEQAPAERSFFAIQPHASFHTRSQAFLIVLEFQFGDEDVFGVTGFAARVNFLDLAFEWLVLLSVDLNLGGKADFDLSNFVTGNRDFDSHRLDWADFKQNLPRGNRSRLGTFERSAKNHSVDWAFDHQVFPAVLQDLFFGYEPVILQLSQNRFGNVSVSKFNLTGSQ